jgi:cytochrome c oxidase assembly factor CtaG
MEIATTARFSALDILFIFSRKKQYHDHDMFYTILFILLGLLYGWPLVRRFSKKNLAGQVVLITGGGSGIGRRVSTCLWYG